MRVLYMAVLLPCFASYKIILIYFVLCVDTLLAIAYITSQAKGTSKTP